MPEDLEYSSVGRVAMAVRRFGYCRSSDRMECRNCSKCCGWPAVGGYSAGERMVGMTSRWMEAGGEEESRWVRFRTMGVKGDVVGKAFRLIGM